LTKKYNGDMYGLYIAIFTPRDSRILAGIFGGLIGTGGCSVMLPILSFVVYGGDPNILPIAIGTTLAAVIFTTISGAIGHLKIKNLDIEATKYLTLGGIPGVILGSYLFSYLVETGRFGTLSFILGMIFIWPSIRMVREGIFRSQQTPTQIAYIPGNPAYKAIFGFLIGITTGVAGLGGGYALVPGMIYLFDAPVHLAMGPSLAAMIALAGIGGVIKILNGVVDIYAAVSLGLGTTLGAQIGARLIKRFKPATLKLIFGLYFLYVSLKYIFLFFGIRI